MRYIEYAPPNELAEDVKCFWFFEHQFEANESHDESIVPDGCPELIFHIGTPYAEVGRQGSLTIQQGTLLAGQITRPLALRASKHASVLGVRLWPWGAHRYFALPLAKTIDTRTPLAMLCGASTAVVLNSLRKASGDSARMTIIANWLKTLPTVKPRDEVVVSCARHLIASQGQWRPETFVAAAHISTRQLERRFKTCIGLTPKQLSSILRFRSLFDELQADQPSAWLNAAIVSGYFDQAHMIRDFKRYAGKPPQAYYRNMGHLSGALVAG